MSGKNDNLFLAGHDASRISRLEAKLRDNPDDRKLRLQLANAMKRQQRAEEAFRESLGVKQLDVVDYRIVECSDKYALMGIAESLSTFQRSLTAVYDAVTNGAKDRANYGLEAKENSRLYFDYAYPGSRGFVLSALNEQTLFGGKLDLAVETYSQYLEISSTDDAIEASRTLGLAAISELYRWIKSNAAWGYGIDYKWLTSRSVTRGRFIERDKFEFIKEVFDTAEESVTDEVVFDGILVGLDVDTRRFHFAEPDGESIKGRLSDGYGVEAKSVPHRYKAVLDRVTKRTPSTGEASVKYLLKSLVEIA